jgi:hypothetical protein
MLAEIYTNRLYYPDPTHKVQRWWVNDDIMVGGSINDAADYKHLQDDFNIKSVLNVETEHSDVGKNITFLSECQVPDDGTPFSIDIVRHAVSFAKMTFGFGPMYVHCQMGGSRSPAFAYAILRWVFKMNPADALKEVQNGKDWFMKIQNGQLIGGSGLIYGNHPYHKNYFDSIEKALKV